MQRSEKNHYYVLQGIKLFLYICITKHSNTFTTVNTTLNVRIGQTVFTIEKDAYRILADYLDDISARCDEASRKEVVDDVEMRIADLFSGWLGDPANTVDTYLVRRAQETIGRPEEFGELKTPNPNEKEPEVKRLLRSETDCVIGGVCSGMAKFANIDPTLVRVATLLLIIFGGLSLWIYIVLWIFIPTESSVAKQKKNEEKQPYNKHKTR